MTMSNVEAVRAADKQVQDVLAKLTPAATLKMIRDGVNPLEKSIEELETYFRDLPPEYKKEAVENPLFNSFTFTSAVMRSRTSSSCLLAVISPTLASQSALLW